MEPQQANPFISLVPIVAVFLIFYFLVIRPQQKEAQTHKKMLEGLKKGDRVTTSGGLYGQVVGFRGGDVELQIADKVKVQLLRSAVTTVLKDGAAADGAETKS